MATVDNKDNKKSAPASPTSIGGSKQLTAKERKAAQLRQQQQQQRLLLGVGAVVLLIIVIGVVVISSQPADASIPPDAMTHYTDLAALNYIGTTEQGFPYVGKVDAPVVVEELGSFACPICLGYHTDVVNNIFDKLRAGQVKYIFEPVTNIDYDTTLETRGALCAGQQGKFWEFHDTLFDWQSRYAQSDKSAAMLAAGAGKLGLDVNKFNSCLSSDFGKDVIDTAAKKAATVPNFGTPTIFLDGKLFNPAAQAHYPSLSQLRGIIEAAVANNAPAAATSAATSAATAAQ